MTGLSHGTERTRRPKCGEEVNVGLSESGTLKVEPLDNGCWMFTASMNDGIHFRVGVEADEVAARRLGNEELGIQRSRRAEYLAAVDCAVTEPPS